jgi:hypothetical protein
VHPLSLAIAVASFQEDDVDTSSVAGFDPRTASMASDHQLTPSITTALESPLPPRRNEATETRRGRKKMDASAEGFRAKEAHPLLVKQIAETTTKPKQRLGT